MPRVCGPQAPGYCCPTSFFVTHLAGHIGNKYWGPTVESSLTRTTSPVGRLEPQIGATRPVVRSVLRRSRSSGSFIQVSWHSLVPSVKATGSTAVGCATTSSTRSTPRQAPASPQARKAQQGRRSTRARTWLTVHRRRAPTELEFAESIARGRFRILCSHPSPRFP